MRFFRDRQGTAANSECISHLNYRASNASGCLRCITIKTPAKYQICEPVSLANSSKSIQVAKRGTTLYRAVISSNAFVAPWSPSSDPTDLGPCLTTLKFRNPSVLAYNSQTRCVTLLPLSHVRRRDLHETLEWLIILLCLVSTMRMQTRCFRDLELDNKAPSSVALGRLIDVTSKSTLPRSISIFRLGLPLPPPLPPPSPS